MFKLFARLFIWATGWGYGPAPPLVKKFVFIASPHSSNWDMIYMVAYAAVYGVPLRFLMKHTVFWWPLGVLLRAVGGMPIDRRSRHNVVEQLVESLAQIDELALGVPAEGTRGYAKYWKSGFYHIAQGAGLPIIPAYLDWGQKEAGFGSALWPSGDIRADMDILRAFYAGKTGRHPENVGPIRLREEDAEDLPQAATG